jgi:SAM-dependent methyltransferase
MKDIVARFYPEVAAGGFSRADGTVQFYQRVQALIGPNDVVLDFGAGRGANFHLDGLPFRRSLRDLRGPGRHVVGADVDPVVQTNPGIDEAVVFDPAVALPFEDGKFQLIVADWVFEHIPDAHWAARELGRVLAPGGWLCFRTPNRRGYVALANRLVRGRLAARLLSSAQPERKVEDVFPACYRMNTPGTLRKLFPVSDYEHTIFDFDSDPQYHFNRLFVYRAMMTVQTLTPPGWKTTLMGFFRKRDTPARR